MKTLAALLCLLMIGCGTTNPNRRKDGALPYPVSVEVNEPGAKIEVDGEYVGEAPCTITLWGDDNGKFRGGGYVFVNAIPSKSGQFSQQKIYRVPGWGKDGDYIPKKIYFNMSLRDIGNTIDLNINK